MPLHYPTPVKAHLIGTANYLDSYHLPYFHRDLFKGYGIRSKSQGWEILRKANDRKHPD